MIIRKSIPDDVYAIRELHKITWLNTYPNDEAGITIGDIKDKFKDDETPEGKRKIEAKKERCLNKNQQTWVAEERGKIIGACRAEKGRQINRLSAIYVLPDYQGKGVGSELIVNALGWLGNQKDIYVNVVEYNLKAINFYKKHGFVETGKKGVFDSAAKLPSGKYLPEIELVKTI
jgi:GNAT superfamily N-acetyltransferase